MKIGSVNSEVVVAGDGSGGDDATKPVEVRVEELREVVRLIVQEELERSRRLEIDR